ncbi:MAG TPA: RsmE family RNA methyltransferase [Thermoanaerobaculia bacterium]
MAESAPTRPPRVLVPDLAEHRESSEGDGKEKEIFLRKEEREHVRSRRLRDGDEVVALDGKGARAVARIVRAGAAIALSPSKQIFSSSSSFPSSSSSSSLSFPGEPANRVVVALACAEPARVEWAIEKGTECGAAGFVLLDAGRSQRAHVAALAKRIPRLIRIAEEATKQCDRTIVPFVEGPKSTEEFLRGLIGREAFVVLDPSGAAAERSGAHGDLVVAIGPEGGFAPSEILLFAEKSPVFLSLGPRILRLETAVVVALARLVDPA